MGQYQNRTSGILLESAFVGAIPVAPASLLEANDMAGIGYQLMDEMSHKMKKCQKKDILEENSQKIMGNYNEKKIKNRFKKWISEFV